MTTCILSLFRCIEYDSRSCEGKKEMMDSSGQPEKRDSLAYADFLLNGYRAPMTSRPSSAISLNSSKLKNKTKSKDFSHRPTSVNSSKNASRVKYIDKPVKEISELKHDRASPKIDIFVPSLSEENDKGNSCEEDEDTLSPDDDTEIDKIEVEEALKSDNFDIIDEDNLSDITISSSTAIELPEESKDKDKMEECSTDPHFSEISFQAFSSTPDDFILIDGQSKNTEMLSISTNENNKTQNFGKYEDVLEVLERIDNITNNENHQSISSVSVPNSQSTPPTCNSKIENLLNYLENVETDIQSNINCGNTFDTVDSTSNSDNKKRSNKDSKIRELLKKTPTELAEDIINLQLNAEEHIRAEVVLRQALDHQRESMANSANRFQKELNQRLKTQKQEYESAISRHQNFIDQLIEDKKILGDRVDALLAEQINLERKHEDGIKALEHRHGAEIRRLRSLYESSSKLRQEKWVDEKTKRIKEQTVKGLEPELQRLMARHAAEIKELESEKTRSLLSQERDLHQRHLQHVRELRTTWDQEQAELIQKERQMLTNRHSQHLDEVRMMHSEELNRLQDHLKRERIRNSDERGHFEKEAEQIRRFAHERANDEIERIREEEDSKRNILIKKHSNELMTMRESENGDRAEWERNCRMRLDEEWKTRERELKSSLKAERESELAQAIGRLEGDLNKCKENAEVEIEERVGRVKARYELDLKDASEELESHRDKLTKTREELGKKEEENLVLMAVAKQKELYADETQRVNAKLEGERDDIRKSVYGEFSITIDTLTEERSSLLQEVGQLRVKISELQSQMDSEAFKRKIDAEEEAEKLHSRIKSAIGKKDEVIMDMKEKLEKAISENENLETLLHRQTEERIFKKITTLNSKKN